MQRCLACGSQIPEDKRFCGDCGTAVDQGSAATATSAAGAPPVASHPAVDHARFIPGTVVAGRYRIVGLLGRGGMGEVYRADDLKLGHPVALKFLPEGVARDPNRLERFLNEVRTALKVTHPNVCRVHDIGEVDGPSTGSGQSLHYLSMEYVDGEDLASLLRRIGRLPEGKAVQIARQICAGLAAAHEQGILHRDLKPANVMIDGRGRAKITDFGLAAIAETLEGADVRSGTPGYMAPEQMAGKEVTVRSDVYALGLVLFELFTGRRAFEGDTAEEVTLQQQESAPADPSSFVKDLDPAIERTILRCVESDPVGRPASAMSVAASLPGGDPLAAALAEGETPSPEMVAAAGPQGGLKAGLAITLLVIGLVGILGSMLLGRAVWLESRLPWVKSFDALKDDAREIAVDLGYEDPPKDSAGQFEFKRNEYMSRARGGEEDVSETIRQPGREPVSLLFRQSPGHLVPMGFGGNVSLNDPSPDPGDFTLRLDLQGRLRYLRVIPERLDRTPGPFPEPDWETLFAAAGLDIGSFEPTEPTIQPPGFADSRAAWVGSLAEDDSLPVRIEASSLRGKPVYFRTIQPWQGELWSADQAQPLLIPEGVGIAIAVVALTVFGLLLVGAVLLAVRSLRLGRGDRKGALRVALAVFAIRMLGWLLAGHHVANLAEVVVLVRVLAGALTIALLAWLLYLALEPYVRRFWPEAMVSWNRLLAGRIRDPLVGRDVLIGFAALCVSSVVMMLALWWAESSGVLSPIPQDRVLPALRGGRFALGALFSAPLLGLTMASIVTLCFLLLRIIVRKTWIAVIVMCVLWASFQGLAMIAFATPDRVAAAVAFGVIQVSVVVLILVTLLVRFGFLALMAHFICSGLLGAYPQSLDPSLPFFTTSLIGPAVVAVFGILAYRAAVGKQAGARRTT